MSFFRDLNRFDKILYKTSKRYLIYKFQAIKQPPLKNKIAAKQLRLLLEELGPTFIKLGQLISVRPDLVPPDFIFELENLQDNVAPMPFDFIKQQIEGQLKKPLDEIFSCFDEKPLASA